MEPCTHLQEEAASIIATRPNVNPQNLSPPTAFFQNAYVLLTEGHSIQAIARLSDQELTEAKERYPGEKYQFRKTYPQEEFRKKFDSVRHAKHIYMYPHEDGLHFTEDLPDHIDNYLIVSNSFFNLLYLPKHFHIGEIYTEEGVNIEVLYNNVKMPDCPQCQVRKKIENPRDFYFSVDSYIFERIKVLSKTEKHYSFFWGFKWPEVDLLIEPSPNGFPAYQLGALVAAARYNIPTPIAIGGYTFFYKEGEIHMRKRQ